MANTGLAPSFDLIILDESHKLRNNATIRSKLAMKLIEKSKFTLYLSATAGQNPLELSYLSSLLAQTTKQSVSNLKDFEVWCKKMNFGVSRGDFGKWIWDGGQESIDKVHNLLFKGNPQVALRRTPKDIKGYPEINRILTNYVLSSENLYAYNLVWSDFKNQIIERVKKIKTKIKKNLI